MICSANCGVVIESQVAASTMSKVRPRFVSSCASGLEVPHASVTVYSIQMQNALLATGRFLSFLPATMLHFSANHLPVKVLPVELPIKSRPVGITTLKNRTQSPLVHLFTKCAREMAKALSGT